MNVLRRQRAQLVEIVAVPELRRVRIMHGKWIRKQLFIGLRLSSDENQARRGFLGALLRGGLRVAQQQSVVFEQRNAANVVAVVIKRLNCEEEK